VIFFTIFDEAIFWAIVRDMIGVFDSGFGGLHVLRSVTTRLPQYGYIYLGDSVRAPYGPRSSEEVYAFTNKEWSSFFHKERSLSCLRATLHRASIAKNTNGVLAEKSKKKVIGVPYSVC